MRALLQRAAWGRVSVDGVVVGEIGDGLVILLGVLQGDQEEQATTLAKKIVDLRIFEDQEGRMNQSLLDVGGEALVVSQFTLYADCRKGRRPFFGNAEEPARARTLCDRFVQAMRALGTNVETGRFGAAMKVELCNEGPVTILLDTEELAKPRGGG